MKEGLLLLLVAFIFSHCFALTPVVFVPGYSSSVIIINSTVRSTECQPFVLRFTANACPLLSVSRRCLLETLTLDEAFRTREGVQWSVPDGNKSPEEAMGALWLYAAPFFAEAKLRGFAYGRDVVVQPYLWPISLWNQSLVESLKETVERLWNAQGGGRKVALMGNSEGSIAIHYATQALGEAWTRKYVHSLWMSAQCATAGQGAGLMGLLTGQDYCAIGEPFVNSSSPWFNVTRYWGASWTFPPDPRVYGPTALVQTPQRNYTAADTEALIRTMSPPSLAALQLQAVRKAIAVRSRGPPAFLPVVMLIGHGHSTVVAGRYSRNNCTDKPALIESDGDGDEDLLGAQALGIWNTSNVTVLLRKTDSLGWFWNPVLVTEVFDRLEGL